MPKSKKIESPGRIIVIISTNECCGTCRYWNTKPVSPFCMVAQAHRDALRGINDSRAYNHLPCKDYNEKIRANRDVNQEE